MKKIFLFVTVIIAVTVMSTTGCKSHRNFGEWKNIPTDTIIGGSHLEFDDELSFVSIEKEDGSQKDSRIFEKDGDNVKLKTQDGHHLIEVWLEEGHLHVRDSFIPVTNWESVPTDTMIGETRLNFSFNDSATVVTIKNKEDSQRIVLTNDDFLKVFTFDGKYELSIWTEEKDLHITEKKSPL